MPEERLNLIGRNALVVQVDGNRDAERVRRDANSDSGPLGVSSHHLVNIISDHLGSRELAGPPRGGAKEIDGLPFAGLRVSAPLLLPDAASLQVLVEEKLEVMGDRDFPRLAPLLVEEKHLLARGLIIMMTLEGGHGPNSGPRVGERLDDELVA